MNIKVAITFTIVLVVYLIYAFVYNLAYGNILEVLEGTQPAFDNRRRKYKLG